MQVAAVQSIKAELFLDRLEEITDQASDGIQKAKL
jgi:hypothetical protein